MQKPLVRLVSVVPALLLAGCGALAGNPAPQESPDANAPLDAASAFDATGAGLDGNLPPEDLDAGYPDVMDPFGADSSCGRITVVVLDGSAALGVDDGGDAALDDAGLISSTTCAAICTPATTDPICACTVNGPQTQVSCHGCACLGRRPERFVLGAFPLRARVGMHFARGAQLEAISVAAFRILRAELAFHGAPKRLVRAAERAARDEVRHTRTTAALARRFGARTTPVKAIANRAPRPLDAIALENVREGCVRETYGAMEASFQARAAADPVVRASMKRIARDEARHASLAWEIDAWARQRMGASARKRLDEERAKALAVLARGLGRPRAPELRLAAGMPSVEHALSMHAELADALTRRG